MRINTLDRKLGLCHRFLVVFKLRSSKSEEIRYPSNLKCPISVKCLINYTASIVQTIKYKLFLACALFQNSSVAFSLFLGDLQSKVMKMYTTPLKNGD